MDVLTRGIPLLVAALTAFACARADIPARTPALPAEKTLKWWMPRFESVKARAAKGGYEVVFLGDSITHKWEKDGKAVWAKHFADGSYRALNGGFCGDTTENLLWRIDNGMLDGTDPKAFVLLIGTNNTGHRKVEVERPLDTVLGILAVIDRLHAKFPQAKVVLHPIFPRGAQPTNEVRRRNDAVNRALALIGKYAQPESFVWCNFNEKLMTEKGVVEKATFPDLLHPSEAGYEIWARELLPALDFALGRTTTAPAFRLPPAGGKPSPYLPQVSTRWFKPKGEPRLSAKRLEAQASAGKVLDLVLIGDSITHRWELPAAKGGGREVFASAFGDKATLNLGFGGDTTQNLLWALTYGGLLDGYRTKNVTLLIGTNNIWGAVPEDIAKGIEALVKMIREKQPAAVVHLMPILPRECPGRKGAAEALAKIGTVNELILPLADGEHVRLLDLRKKFLTPDGRPDPALYADKVTHPNAKGYVIWAETLKQVLVR